MGLRGAYFKQTFFTDARNPSPTETHLVFPFKAESPDTFWGVGIRGGADGELHFCKYLGIFGKLSGSLLYGQIDAPIKTITNLGTPEEAIEKIKNKYDEMKPSAQIIIGLSFKACFRDTTLLDIKTGFEMNYWWDQENSVNSGLPRDYGTPLEFAGLTVSAKLEF